MDPRIHLGSTNPLMVHGSIWDPWIHLGSMIRVRDPNRAWDPSRIHLGSMDPNNGIYKGKLRCGPLVGLLVGLLVGNAFNENFVMHSLKLQKIIMFMV